MRTGGCESVPDSRANSYWHRHNCLSLPRCKYASNWTCQINATLAGHRYNGLSYWSGNWIYMLVCRQSIWIGPTSAALVLIYSACKCSRECALCLLLLLCDISCLAQAEILRLPIIMMAIDGCLCASQTVRDVEHSSCCHLAPRVQRILGVIYFLSNQTALGRWARWRCSIGKCHCCSLRFNNICSIWIDIRKHKQNKRPHLLAT